MKVSLDACIFAAYVHHYGHDPQNILDIGCGTGLLSLMLGQRFPKAQITGVEMEEGSISDCQQNFRNAPYQSRLHLVPTRVQDANLCSYDMIVSNPPFFRGGTTSPYKARQYARHQKMLPPQDLACTISQTLKSLGVSWILISAQEEEALASEFHKYGLHVRSRTTTKPTEKHKPNRVMLSFAKKKPPSLTNDELIIYTEHRVYSPRINELLQGFFLRFSQNG